MDTGDKKSLKKNLYGMWDVDNSYPLVAPVPDNIMIEITNACNLRCPMCYQHRMQRKKGYMSRDIFENVIRQAAGLGLSNAGLFTTGEAFLHPRVFDFIRFAKDCGIRYVYITSNGVLLDEEKIGKIFESGLDSIKFSIDAASPAMYEKERPGGDWGRLLRNIEILRRERNRRGQGLNIFGSYVITADNIGELGRFREIFGGLLDEVYYSFLTSQGGQQNEQNDSRIAAWVRGKMPTFILEREDWNPCNLLWNRFIVTYDGKLTACCVDFETRMVYGDLNESSLAESWNNVKMQEYRRIHRERAFERLPMCNVCDVVRTDFKSQDEAINELISNKIARPCN
jgi:radical SAM protein with 4Fe4S-binding SPASM domain